MIDGQRLKVSKTAKMNEEVKRELFEKEYFHIQEVIEAFDGRTLTIKAWSITASLAGLSVAFIKHVPSVLLLSALSSVMFWLLEGMWKTFQFAYYDRSGEIEAYFSGEGSNLKPMQIGGDWYRHWKEGGMKRLFRILFWPHVALPHCFVFAVGVTCFTLHLLELIEV